MAAAPATRSAGPVRAQRPVRRVLRRRPVRRSRRRGPPRGPDVETVMELDASPRSSPVSAQGRPHDAGRVRDVRRLRLPARHALRPAARTARARARCASVRRVDDRPDRHGRAVPSARRLGTDHRPSPVPDVPRRGPRAGTARSTSRCPAGIDDGQRLRLTGRGPAAPRGGTAGDLFVAVRVAPHAASNARRRPLAPDAASRSCRPRSARTVPLETFDGDARDRRAVGHPARRADPLPGSACRRCAPAGAATSSSKSTCDVPTNLTPEQAELLAQLAELRGEEVTPPSEGLFSRIRSAFRS